MSRSHAKAIKAVSLRQHKQYDKTDQRRIVLQVNDCISLFFGDNRRLLNQIRRLFSLLFRKNPSV